MNEQDLILDVKANGNEESFSKLIELHKTALFNFLGRFTKGTPIDSSDIYNKALLRAWDHINQFKDGNSFRSWLFQISKNVFFNEYKRIKKQTLRELPIEDSSESPEFVETQTPSSQIMRTEDLSKISKNLESLKKSLSKKHAEVFELVFEQGKSQAEVSALLKCSLGTVRTRVFYMRKQLLENFKKHEYHNAH